MSDRVLIISGLMCSRTALAHGWQKDISHTKPLCDLKMDGWKMLSNHRMDKVKKYRTSVTVKESTNTDNQAKIISFF